MSTLRCALQTWGSGGPGLACRTLPGAPPTSPQGQEREGGPLTPHTGGLGGPPPGQVTGIPWGAWV